MISPDFDLDYPFTACLFGDTPKSVATASAMLLGLGFGLALLFFGTASALFNYGAFQPLQGMGVALFGGLLVHLSLTTPY